MAISPSAIVGPGTTVRVTVNVAPATAANYAVSGMASLYNGSTLVGSTALVNGQAMFSVTIPALGTYQLTANYSGSTLFAPSSAYRTPVYAVPPSTTSLIVSSQSVSAGTPVSLVVAVKSGTAAVGRGTVLFCDASAPVCADSALLGTAALRPNGMAVMSVTFGLGVHTVKAFFTGTTAAQPSSSAAQTITVNGLRATTTTLTSSLTGSAYSLTAHVTANGTQAPVGNISFQNVTAGTTMSTLALAAGTPQLTFAGSTANSGSFPSALAVGDFNVDGRPDIIGSNAGSNSLFLLTAGSGGAVSMSIIPTPGPTQALVIADFNGDNLPDVAAVNMTGNSVTILLGNGNGTFHTASTIAINGPAAIAAGDFDADGNQDLAVATSSGVVSILLGNGTGTFRQGPMPIPGVQTVALAAADFNGDGRPDLAVLCFNQGAYSVSILVGVGNGSFTLSTNIAVPATNGMAIGDFNGDGKPDLALSISSSCMVMVYIGDGNGGFGPPVAVSTGALIPQSLATADVNGDGKLDLVVPGGSAVLVLLGDGKGGFPTQSTAAYANDVHSSVAVADFSGDGMPDIVVANSYGSTVNRFLNTQTTTSAAMLGGVTVTGSAKTVRASYPGSTMFGASSSGNLTLVPTL